MSELIFLILWSICGLISIYINHKEYQIILRAGYYRMFPDNINDYILCILIGPIGLCFSFYQYYQTKSKYNI